MSGPDREALLELAVAAAHEAGELLAARFGGPASGVDVKSSATDLVSDADREAESLIRARLRAARPRDALLGEEGGASPGAGALRWVFDPLDGTVNYLFGIPAWSVAIACEDASGTLVAVVHHPDRGETFTAVRDGGAFLGGARLSVRRPHDLARALVGTGFAYDAERRARQGELLARVLPEVRDVRRGGSAALDLAWVAAGRLDAFYEHGLQPWDRTAGELLVREAGGRVAALGPRDGLPEGLLAAAPAVFEPLLALLR